MNLNNGNSKENNEQIEILKKSERKYFLTDEEIEIVKRFITENKNQKHILDFDNDDIEWDIKILDKLESTKEQLKWFIFEYYLSIKAILIMKINGAKSIDDLDKLNSNNLSINKLEDIKELEIQAEVQQQQDLEKANLLSEQIKNNIDIIESISWLTEEWIDILKDYFTRYWEELNKEFNNTIEENIIKMKSFPIESYNRNVFKGIITMQKNWAKNINEFDKLYID